MNIEFFKNNEKQEIDSNSITFIKSDYKIIRETEEVIISLDFMKKECFFTLKRENITLKINVIEMSILNEKNNLKLNYILESEPEVKNSIKIKI